MLERIVFVSNPLTVVENACSAVFINNQSLFLLFVLFEEKKEEEKPSNVAGSWRLKNKFMVHMYYKNAEDTFPSPVLLTLFIKFFFLYRYVGRVLA